MPYIGKSPEFGVRQRYYFTQSGAGATSISGTDDNGITLKFTDGNFVDVFLNGVLLVDGVDYGTSTANTISNLSALSISDVIEVLVYDVFNIAKNQAEVTRTRYYKTASGSETSISGNDDSGVAIEFPAGAQLDVSLNGVSLVAGSDYNTSTANTISGLTALTAGNVIEIVKYEKFVVSDTVSKAAGGTFGGAIAATSFTGDGSGLTNLAGTISFAVISDQKASGTAGGTSSTSFTKRDLNTEVFDPDGIVTISSDQFTLGAGTYIIDWQCPAYRSNSVATLLYDVTAGANGETGTSTYGNVSSGTVVTFSTGRARVVLTANNTYEIRMKVSSAYTSAGFGVVANSDPETYTTVHIMKIG